MNDVPVVEVRHEAQAGRGEDEGRGLVVERPPLPGVQVGPQLPVEPQEQQERQVGGRQVQQEAFLVDSWKRGIRNIRIRWFFAHPRSIFIL